MRKYVISLQGENVWHNVLIEYIINNIEEDTLKKVSTLLEDKYNIKIEPFTKVNSSCLIAKTSIINAEVIIEEVEEFNPT